MTTWHVPPDVLVRFARAPEDLDETTASSAEQHLVACAECRASVAAATAPPALDASWAAIADVIDQPRRTLVERALSTLGMPGDLARLVGATPGMRLAWLGTISLLAVVAVAVSRGHDTDALFLVLAPLLPVGSVMLTFLPTEEPAGESAVATPMYGAGIVLRRALAALVPTFAILMVASVALPDLTDAARWLVPGLALAVGSLLFSTYVRPVVAGATLAAGWLVLLVGVQAMDGRHLPLARTAVFAPSGQLLALTLALVGSALLFVRRDRFSTVEVIW